MQEYRCILVGIDGSPQAFRAFEKAVSIAKRNEALLLAVHVIDQQLPKMLEFAPLNEDIFAKEEAQAMNLLRNCEDYAHSHHFAPVKSLVYRGSPRLILAHQLVETYQVDLIVVGQSGLHALEKLMLGSVASYLVREARCDCLVVPFE